MRWPWSKAKPEVEGYDPMTDPLTLTVNRAFNTGTPVYWTEGDPLPDPEGRVLPVMTPEEIVENGTWNRDGSWTP